MLKDLLTSDLKIVFCGTAAGKISATLGEYYANAGNIFWSVLFEVGLTPKKLSPSEYKDLLSFGIGLTDVIKDQSGCDTSIDFKQFKMDGFVNKITRFSPDVLAFNGKGAANIFFGVRSIQLGLQPKKVGKTKLFVAPSTSGAAKKYWNVDLWYELANLVLKTAT